MSYSQLPTHPPAYSGGDDSLDLEMNGQNDQVSSSLTSRERIRLNINKFKSKFNTKIKEPLIDPILELYSLACNKVEFYLSKMGNPLIVRRFAYVLFISVIVYLLTLTGVFPQGKSVDFGTFSDRAELLDFVDKSINLKQMEETLEYLSSMDHISGTVGDLTLAKFVETSFRQNGINIVEFQELKTLLNYPNKSLIKFEDQEIDLTEQFMPLSFNGEVTGNLIYVGYGLNKDYETLKTNNVQLDGSIAIVKFDDIYPVSQKLLTASSYGIKGILFISSNKDFPDSFERRSCEIPQFYTGDPLTPGWSSSMMTNRLDFKDSTMTKIPSISLTRNQITPLLAKLDGKGLKIDDDGFSGDGSSTQLTFINNVLYQQDHSIWNVLGKINGKEQNDKAIIIGAQRDSPCKGAIYPNSGTTVMLEIIDVLNKLHKQFNWYPLRSIYFISFDGTEYNYAGVSELIEAKFGEIKKETISYLDLSDVIGGEDLEVQSNALLTSSIASYQNDFNFTFKDFDEYGNFIPFMVEGVPIVKLGYEGHLPTPKYTCQDTFQWFKDNIDGNFEKSQHIVKLIMRIILDAVDDPLVPFDITEYVHKLDSDFKDLQEYINFKRPNLLNDLSFNPIVEGLLKLKQIGKDYELWKKAWNDLVAEDSGMEPSLLSVHRWNWNSRLTLLEKIFTDNEGVPGRRWFRNLVHGPQLFKPEDGNFSWFSYPSLRDMVDRASKDDINKEIQRVGDLITNGVTTFVS